MQICAISFYFDTHLLKQNDNKYSSFYYEINRKPKVVEKKLRTRKKKKKKIKLNDF